MIRDTNGLLTNERLLIKLKSWTMCKFSHFDRRNRSTTSKFLTLAFVISLFVHGLAQTSTGVWLLVEYFSACAFVRKFYAPFFVHLVAGVSALFLSVSSIIATRLFNYSSFTRYFCLGMFAVFALEISSGLSAVILNKLIDTDLPEAMGNNFIETVQLSNSSGGQGDAGCWNKFQEQYQCCGYTNSSDWCSSTGNKTTCDKINDDLFKGCKCTKSENDCYQNSLFRKPCLNAALNEIKFAYRIVIIMDSVFGVVQCLSYMVVNCIMLKLNSKRIIDTYKPKVTESEERF